jgi:hypothetical protein
MSSAAYLHNKFRDRTRPAGLRRWDLLLGLIANRDRGVVQSSPRGRRAFALPSEG